MRTKRAQFLGFAMVLLACAANAAAAPAATQPAAAYEIKTPSAHNPCYDQPGLWPEGVKETAYYKQKWEPARVLVWAKGKVLEKGPASTLYPAENWLENGKPAKQDADENCDLVFPDQKELGWDKWLRINPTVSCHHLTVGQGVSLDNLGKISGNLWSKGWAHSWGGAFVGKQNTFVRVGSKDRILKMYAVNKDPSASVEIVDRLRLCDWLEVNSGQLIVGPGAVLEGGNRHQNIIAPRGTLALMSGATFKTFEFKRQAYDLDVYGKVLAGTPERPLTKDAFFSLSGKAKEHGTPQGFHTPNDRSIRFNKTSSLIVHSADPTKARLVFTAVNPKAPKLDAQFGGSMTLDGVLFDHFDLGGIQMTDPEARKTWKNVFFGENNASKGDVMFAKIGVVMAKPGNDYGAALKQLEELSNQGKQEKSTAPMPDMK